MNVTVFCGSTSGSPAYQQAAETLGKWIAEQGHTLVYGGGDSGLMGIVAKTAFEGGSPVVGVLPGNVELITSRPQPYVTELITAKDMTERKRIMEERADAFIALPGGIGTLDEMTEVITLCKLGLYDKKCVMYDRNGFYEPFKAMIGQMEKDAFLPELDFLLFSDDINEIDAFLKEGKDL